MNILNPRSLPSKFCTFIVSASQEVAFRVSECYILTDLHFGRIHGNFRLHEMEKKEINIHIIRRGVAYMYERPRKIINLQKEFRAEK